jgi:hypothetical protein
MLAQFGMALILTIVSLPYWRRVRGADYLWCDNECRALRAIDSFRATGYSVTNFVLNHLYKNIQPAAALTAQLISFFY